MRDSNKPKGDEALRETIAAAFEELSRDEELTIQLDTLLDLFQRDRSTALPAFEAVRRIAAHEWGRKDGLERVPTAEVKVPWWVVQALAIGFNTYADARANGLITPLGRAYGLEGGGQGKTTRVAQSANELRDQRLVMGIALRVQRGMTVRAAIEAMITEDLTSLSFDRVEKIWAKHSEKARAMKFD